MKSDLLPGNYPKYLTLLLLLLSLSCTRKSSEHHHHQEKSNQTQPKVESKVQVDDKQRAEIISVFASNEELHLAFFNYDPQKVQNQAKKLADLMQAVSHKEIAAKLQNSQVQLEKITAERARADNDRDYEQVSRTMIEILQHYDISDAYRAYHCPMIKMQWVQNAEKMPKVHNPFAPEMPHCGEHIL